jgi:uncharacterized protein GlcG (DUF336 family)
MARRKASGDLLLVRKTISLALAKQMVAAAEAEAATNLWNVVIAIVDEGGHLILLHRMDDTQLASVEVAPRKARTAAMFRRSTKVLEDAVKGGRTPVLNLAQDITPVQGGLPVISGGRVIGGIGVSGVDSGQDEQIARAGTGVVK